MKSGASNTGIPRLIEAFLALLGLMAVCPFLLLAALLVVLSSPGPILYRQERVGLDGRKFVLYKFRSMRVGVSALQITAKNDDRVTWAGRVLRKTKIDELPELWNVLKGDMALVGPRPEVEKYVDRNNSAWRLVLSVRPGITDPVTLSLRNEEELLENVEGDRERFYLETLQPMKLRGYAEYLRQRGPWRDVKVILKTVLVIIFPGRVPSGEGQVPSGEGQVPSGEGQVPAIAGQVPSGEGQVPAVASQQSRRLDPGQD